MLSLKSVWNHLKKNKFHILISISGLAAGMLFFIHLLIYIGYEREYDMFVRDHEQVYRVNYDITQDGEKVLHSAKTPRKLFRVIKDEIPGVKYTAMAYVENVLVNYEGHLFSDQYDLWVEGDFAEIFGIEMIKGVATLNDAWKCIISESKAFEIFGEEDPVGKVLRVNEGMLHEITGVFKDIPSNSHIKFDYFMPIRTWVEMGAIAPPAREDFTGSAWWTYIKLDKGINAGEVERSLDIISEKYLTHLKRQNRTGKFSLQPLNKLHYSTGRDGELGVSIRENTVDALYFIAYLILIVIWLNYLNLSAALSRKRMEVLAIFRKMGAGRRDLIKLSLIESIIINFCALVLAIILYFATTGLFSKIINVPVGDGFIDYRSILMFLCFIFPAGAVLTAIVAAIPSLKADPASAHQTRISKNRASTWLVGLQFFVSCFLIACSLMVTSQIRFMQNAELGVDLRNVVVLQGAASTHSDSLRRQHFIMFREDVLSNNGFTYGTASMDVPGQPVRFRTNNLALADRPGELKQEVMIGNIDDGYIGTYGLKLLAGRNFEQPFLNDTSYVLITNSVCGLLGFESPDDAINRRLRIGRDIFTVKGVVNDFHHEGLKKPVMPMIFRHVHPFEFGFYSFRIEGNTGTAINNLSRVWPEHYPGDPMNYFFSPDFFNEQYDEEKRLGRILAAFTFFSVIISALGLYGLISFFTAQRTKEIGLRKVNGATTGNILLMLFRAFLRFEVIAFVFAGLIAWFVMQKWLESFITKAVFGWQVFAITGLVAFGVSIISVLSQSYRAAIKNPVHSLMYE